MKISFCLPFLLSLLNPESCKALQDELFFFLLLILSTFPMLSYAPPPDPRFVAAHLIPDNDDRDNDKVYFFFNEKASEAGDREEAIHARVGRVCAVR